MECNFYLCSIYKEDNSNIFFNKMASGIVKFCLSTVHSKSHTIIPNASKRDPNVGTEIGMWHTNLPYIFLLSNHFLFVLNCF